MILVIALTLIIAYAITTLVVYRQTIHIMEGEVRQEADYINVALDTSGESYLKTMDNVPVPSVGFSTIVSGAGGVTVSAGGTVPAAS